MPLLCGKEMRLMPLGTTLGKNNSGNVGAILMAVHMHTRYSREATINKEILKDSDGGRFRGATKLEGVYI